MESNSPEVNMEPTYEGIGATYNFVTLFQRDSKR